MAYNWNYLSERNMNQNVVKIIKSLFGYLAGQSWATGIWPGSGYRTGSVEHASGTAVDIMISPKVNQVPTADQRAKGKALADLLIRHGKALHIQWVLFSLDDKVTWSYNLDRGSWNKLADRGGVAANHRDHVHVKFKTSAVLPNGFVWGSGGNPVTSKPEPVWDGTTYPGRDVFAIGSQHAAVTKLGQRLVVHGFGKHYKVGPGVPMGPADVANCKDFQLAQGWTGKDADGYPGPETWRRLLANPGGWTPKPGPVVSLRSVVSAAKTDPSKKGTPTTYPADVRIVEAALVKENLLKASLVDGHFGTATIQAYSAWQRWLGYSGKDADGIPGRESLTKLGARNGFTVIN